MGDAAQSPVHASSRSGEGVFLNCPFDSDYRPVFEAIVFTVMDCGFTCHCALESDNSGEARIDKIYRLIQSCRFGIHDLSRVELDSGSKLPRFNMPFELGVFLGAKRYGSKVQRSKSCLILEGERYSYQKYLSDLAGHDTHAHGNDSRHAMDIVIKWLQIEAGRSTLPGARKVGQRYRDFQESLRPTCDVLGWEPASLSFTNLTHLIHQFLKINRVP